MTIQTATIATAPKQRTRRFVPATAGAVLALAAVASIGAWQASRDGGARISEQQAASLPTPATIQRAAARAADIAPTYYLVGLPAQAAAVEAALEEANAVQATSGEPSLAGRVEQLESAEAEAQLFEAIADLNTIRYGLGIPPVRVIDLRPGGELAAPAATPVSHALVVASRDDISEAYARLVERHRALDSTTPLTVTVVVGSAGISVTEAYAQYVERLRALDGSTPIAVTVIDERPGGPGERYAERAPLAATAPVTTTGGMAELYAEQRAAARGEVARLERMGGMAELYRDHAASASSAV